MSAPSRIRSAHLDTSVRSRLRQSGREQEALEFLRNRETREGDARSRDYLFALRAPLEREPEASIQARNRVTLNLDPEALFCVARTFARLGEVERALEELERVITAFFCYPVFVQDSWLDPLWGDARFLRMLHALEAKHRPAAGTVIEHGGERVVGHLA